MSEEQQWHYLINGEQHGPVTDEELAELAAAGDIAPDTLVWTGTLEEWIEAGTIEGLFPSPTAPAEAVPAGPRLITGSAAQSAAPLATAAQPVAAAPVEPAPAAPAGGFALGGSLAGGPHLSSPGGTGGVAGAPQNLRIQSIGIINPAVWGAFLFPLLSFVILTYLVMRSAFAIGIAPGQLGSGLSGEVIFTIIKECLFTAPMGFIFGLVGGLLFNLSCRMTGGFTARVIQTNW